MICNENTTKPEYSTNVNSEIIKQKLGADIDNSMSQGSLNTSNAEGKGGFNPNPHNSSFNSLGIHRSKNIES